MTEEISSLNVYHFTHVRSILEMALVIEDLQTHLAYYGRVKDPGGSTYVHWGRTTCPETSDLVYDGYAGGGSHAESGTGTNFICLPKDPEWAPEQSPSLVGYVHGAEYETHGSI